MPRLIAFDVETVAMKPIVAPPLVCGAFSDGCSAELLDRKDTIERFREALRECITGCNIVFDLAVMVVAEPRLLPHVFDALEQNRVSSVDINETLHDIGRRREWVDQQGRTQVDCWLYIDPETRKDIGRYSLVFLEKRYLGIDRSAEKENGWRLRYGELVGLPVSSYPKQAAEYPKADALNTWRVHQAQEHHNNHEARGRWMRKAWAYYLQRAWGIRTDRERVEELRAAVTKMHEETVERFTACGFYRGPGQINPKTKSKRPYPKSQWGTKNTEVIKARVTSAYKGRPPLTESGEVSTDRDTLEQSGDELLEQFAETGENEKLYSQYLDVLTLGLKQPIHPEYRFIKTGRPASSKPNLFNLPRDARIRESVIARLGYLLADADFPAIEFVTLAQEHWEIFGRSSMRDALVSGQDPHILVASNFVGEPYAQTFARYKAKERLVVDLRQYIGKTWNYGKGGGMSPPTMVHNCRKKGIDLCVIAGVSTKCVGERVTEWNGRDIKLTCSDCLRVAVKADEAYFQQWPEMVDYFALVKREVRGTGEIKGYAFTRAGCGFTDGANFRFQHRAACGQADALWRLARECYVDRHSPLFGSRPVITPYDQGLVEVPEERAPEAADRLALIMREEMQRVCPDVPIKVEPVLTRRWLKGAEPKRDASGRLEISDAA